jgi:hypothetical protein
MSRSQNTCFIIKNNINNYKNEVEKILYNRIREKGIIKNIIQMTKEMETANLINNIFLKLDSMIEFEKRKDDIYKKYDPNEYCNIHQNSRNRTYTMYSSCPAHCLYRQFVIEVQNLHDEFDKYIENTNGYDLIKDCYNIIQVNYPHLSKYYMDEFKKKYNKACSAFIYLTMG